MRRVGGVSEEAPAEDYHQVGAHCRDVIRSYLPEGWSWSEGRFLDFGAGAGRTLRHFSDEAVQGTEFWGCDIDQASIEWAKANLPQFRFFRNEETPPLAVPDAHFDVVYAMSVFTHITVHWADWLVELHRVLRPGGLLIASYLSKSLYESLVGEPYVDDQVGMMIVRAGFPWDGGGPYTFLSQWWVEAHWSPAFEVLRMDADELGPGHGVILGRRRPEAPDLDSMLAPKPLEPREAVSALNNVRLLYSELESVRHQLLDLEKFHKAEHQAWQSEIARLKEDATKPDPAT